ncbi:MAG: ribosomal-processing cysteine protease Prp [Christensenellales bacterium]
MTKVTIEKKGNSICKVVCDGHTNYGEKGEDIVCSALSSIVQTALMGVLLIAGVNAKTERDDERGYLLIIIPDGLSSSCRHDVDVILNTMLLGVSDLNEGFSDFIELEVKNL